MRTFLKKKKHYCLKSATEKVYLYALFICSTISFYWTTRSIAPFRYGRLSFFYASSVTRFSMMVCYILLLLYVLLFQSCKKLKYNNTGCPKKTSWIPINTFNNKILLDWSYLLSQNACHLHIIFVWNYFCLWQILN